MTLLMRLLTLVVGGLVMLSFDARRNQGNVVGGILSFLIFIVSSLPSLGLLSTMTGVMVLLLIPGMLWCFAKEAVGSCCA